MLKTPIPGYNNLLRESTETNMKFGYNKELNFKPVVEVVPEKKKSSSVLPTIALLSAGVVISKYLF